MKPTPENKLIVNHMCATNNANGNPRRCFVVQSMITGLIVDVIDEGYDGGQYWRTHYPQAVEGIRFEVTPREYRNLLRNHAKTST